MEATTSLTGATKSFAAVPSEEKPTRMRHAFKQVKDVEFQDVSYTVTERKNFIKVSGYRHILRNVSGSFRNGQLSAIMGPSGAGKSSLLNAISGYRTSGVKGHIQINRRTSCYITQEDHHQRLLTVEELMRLACQLKLKNSSKHDQAITEILENLHLNHRRDTQADDLSGGERKRLSIAFELISNPTIFFLDEPTSGLDEVTAAQCIKLLNFLAKQGRTIVCTIHQPSATIFNYFDSIFVLAKGQCVYQGSPRALLPFLRAAKYECPRHYNPSDYIIELCDSDDGSLIPALSDLLDNGKLVYTAQHKNIDDNHFLHRETEDTAYEFRNAVTTFFLESPKNRNRNITDLFGRSYNAPSSDGTFISGANALFEHMKAFSKRFSSQRQQISGFQQFYVLLRFMIMKTVRARIALCIQVAHHILCGLCFGLIFLGLGNQGSRMFDHLKFCVGAILVVVYTQVMVPILSIPMEVKIVKKETFNRWYGLTPYYMALTVSRIPLQILLNMIFLSLIYWMTGLPNQWWRFGLFSAVCQVTSLVAEGMGLAIGATFSITNGSAVGPLIIAPFMGLAIYGFDFAAQIPNAVNLLMKFSYIRVGVVALVLSVFGFDRSELDCDEIYCHFSDPRVLLRFLDIETVSILHQFLLLLAIMIFFRILLFISLKKRCGT